MMTEETLNKIIEGVKKQLRHEEKCIEAIKMIFPESYPPVPSNPLWQAFETAVDAAVDMGDGLRDKWPCAYMAGPSVLSGEERKGNSGIRRGGKKIIGYKTNNNKQLWITFG